MLKFLAAGTHLGGTNLDFQMDQYVYKRKSDGKLQNMPFVWQKAGLCFKVVLDSFRHPSGSYSLSTFIGIYIINLKKTWEKLLLAARAIVAIENPADVCVISSRNTGQVDNTDI